MKSKRIVLVLAVLLAVCMVASFQALAGQSSKKRAYTYEETFLGQLDPGNTKISNGNVHIRGARNLWYIESSDSRISGYIATVFNANLDDTGTGPIWGISYSTDEFGEPVSDGWEGTWNGEMYGFFPYYYSNWVIKGVSHGVGSNEGIKIEHTSAHDHPFGAGVGVGAGSIIDNSE